jgi:hypothetical protein
VLWRGKGLIWWEFVVGVKGFLRVCHTGVAGCPGERIFRARSGKQRGANERTRRGMATKAC